MTGIFNQLNRLNYNKNNDILLLDYLFFENIKNDIKDYLNGNKRYIKSIEFCFNKTIIITFTIPVACNLKNGKLSNKLKFYKKNKVYNVKCISHKKYDKCKKFVEFKYLMNLIDNIISSDIQDNNLSNLSNKYVIIKFGIKINIKDLINTLIKTYPIAFFDVYDLILISFKIDNCNKNDIYRVISLLLRNNEDSRNMIDFINKKLNKILLN